MKKRFYFDKKDTQKKILPTELFFEFSTILCSGVFNRKINNWTSEPPTGIKRHILKFNVLCFSKNKQINTIKTMYLSVELIRRKFALLSSV